MGNKTVKFRLVNKDIFDAIIEGKKRIETRAATPTYITVKVGDILTLICGKKKIMKTVKKVEHYRTISALLMKYKPKMINPNIHSKNDLQKMWYSFPNYKEKIKKFGLIVWHLR